MNMVRCIALRSFTGSKGIIKIGESDLIEKDRAEILEKLKIVKIIRAMKTEQPMEFRSGEC